MEKLALVKLGESEELKAGEQLNRTETSAARLRAWEIVEKESYESFVNEFTPVEHFEEFGFSGITARIPARIIVTGKPGAFYPSLANYRRFSSEKKTVP